MLVLGVVSVPSVGLGAMQRPHCEQNDGAAGERTSHAGPQHQMPEPSSPTSWESGSQHDCPHCPPAECSQVAPCATSPTPTIIEASGTIIPLTVASDGVAKLPIQPGSTSHEPPTPPPQLIS